MDEETSEKILSTLERLYPDARPALKYSSPYELLVAVILSAQCTDERVNTVTAALFPGHDTPEKMLSLSQENLEKIIYSCGFYRNKAKHILEMSRDLVERFGGEVPPAVEDLKSLSGVGQKTANVVASVAFGEDAIAVDTHVYRLAHRLGYSDANTPEKVEKDLNLWIPKSLWSRAHHLLIYHGRRVCHARKPECARCAVREWCLFAKNDN